MDEYIENLLREAGLLDEVDDETRAELIAQMSDSATQLLNTRLVEAMPEEGKAAFDRALDNPDVTQQEVQDIITRYVPDVQKTTTDALDEFRALYLGTAGAQPETE